MPKSQSNAKKEEQLRVYKRQRAVKVVGGWLRDDSKMRMDEKKTWGTYGIYFGETSSIWAKEDENIWLFKHLSFVIR